MLRKKLTGTAINACNFDFVDHTTFLFIGNFIYFKNAYNYFDRTISHKSTIHLELQLPVHARGIKLKFMLMK